MGGPQIRSSDQIVTARSGLRAESCVFEERCAVKGFPTKNKVGQVPSTAVNQAGYQYDYMEQVSIPLRSQAFCSAAMMMLATACSGSPAQDAAAPDAGRNGTPDSGAVADSGVFDSGLLDAGNAVDAGEAVDAGTPAEIDAGMVVGLCPPEAGATGSRAGNTIPNLDLQDCDGNSFQLHDLCATRASHLFIMAGW